jgi:SEC-C motif-containing protein
LLRQERPAGNAEELMRSRFTAHVVRDYRHLHRTYLGTARKPYVEESGGDEMKWTRLVVHQHEPGPKPGTALVDFTAYYDVNGCEQALQEKSEFAQIDGAWLYTRSVRTGPPPVRSAGPKIGRNDPCPCGSGKKYKHCCAGR